MNCESHSKLLEIVCSLAHHTKCRRWRRRFNYVSAVLVAFWFRGCGTVDVNACASAKTQCPEVTAVGGTGSRDPDAGAENRLRDSLVLTGKNLANAAVVFSGPGYDRQPLSQTGRANGERIEVLLPVDVTPNRYTLSVTNADGTQEVPLQILRGEPGSYTIGHGLNLSGDVLSVVLEARCPAGTELVGFDSQAEALCRTPWERGWKYRLPVTVDTANYGRLINENIWVRIDFGAALIAAGVPSAVSIDPESVRVVDETIRPFAEVPSKILRTYDSPNDGYLWFNTQSTIENGRSRTFYVYFTDEAKRKPRYHLQPPPDVAATYFDSTILVVRGDYKGAFSARRNSIPTIGAGSHNCIGIGDFDNDGDLDYVLARYQDPFVYYVQNTGGGDGFSGFLPPIPIVRNPIAENQHCMGVAVADYNKDGHLDVIVERDAREDGGMRLLVGRGDGSFEDRKFPGELDLKCWYRELDVTDFNKDSILDVVQGTIATENSSCPWYIYWGEPGWVEQEEFVAPVSEYLYNEESREDLYAVAVGDFTDDGFPDVLIGGGFSGSAGTARGQFKNAGADKRQFGFEGHWPHTKAACDAENAHGWAKAYDWDHDGYDDIIGSLICDHKAGKKGLWYWHRNPAAAWQFDTPTLVAKVTGEGVWSAHGVTAPRLGNALNFVVTPGKVAEILAD